MNKNDYERVKKKTVTTINKFLQKQSIEIIIYYHKHQKQDLGGLKDIENSKEYFHYFAQTNQKKTEHPVKFHRDTQIFDINTQSTITKRESSTQCPKPEIFIDNRQTIQKTPKKYFDSKLWEERRITAALFIQKMIRGCLSRKRMSRIKNLKNQIAEEEINLKKKFLVEKEKKNQKKVQKRLQPKKQQDFQSLLEELEKWKKNEIEKTKQNQKLTETEKQEIYSTILFKEIELLQTIEKLRMKAAKTNKVENIHKFLQELGEPKKWMNYNGRYSSVTTPLTEISSNLFQLYTELNEKKVTVEERLNILLKLKTQIVKQKDDLVEEIKSLINREADMIQRKRPMNSLEGLRLRLSNLFQRYIEDPKNNPELMNYKRENDFALKIKQFINESQKKKIWQRIRRKENNCRRKLRTFERENGK